MGAVCSRHSPHHLNCPKSLWLLKQKPDRYPHGELSDYMKKMIFEVYKVEGYVQELIKNQPNAASYSFQSIFQTQRGLYAKADVIAPSTAYMPRANQKSAASNKYSHCQS
jgi:hypothetical protein